jgi:hypothetical protein
VDDRAFNGLRHVVTEVALREPGPVAIPGGYVLQRYLEHDDHTIVVQVEDRALFLEPDAWEAWHPQQPAARYGADGETASLAVVDWPALRAAMDKGGGDDEADLRGAGWRISSRPRSLGAQLVVWIDAANSLDDNHDMERADA